MKKTLLNVAVVALSIFTFNNAMAQDNQCDKKNCREETCDKNNVCVKKGHKTIYSNPFAGIELTDEQKEKLQALKSQCKSQKGNRKKNRQYRDSVAREAKSKQLAEIKKILTHDQYVQFLENKVLNSKMKAPKHNRGGKNKGPKCTMQQNCQNKKP